LINPMARGILWLALSIALASAAHAMDWSYWDTDGGMNPFVGGCVQAYYSNTACSPIALYKYSDYCLDRAYLMERVNAGFAVCETRASNTPVEVIVHCGAQCQLRGLGQDGHCVKTPSLECPPWVSYCECFK
jgi:hypothetical protein